MAVQDNAPCRLPLFHHHFPLAYIWLDAAAVRGGDVKDFSSFFHLHTAVQESAETLLSSEYRLMHSKVT